MSQFPREYMAMKRYLALTILMLVSLPRVIYAEPDQREADAPVDMIVVLSNSRSMKASDPEFLIKRAVSAFVDSLPKDSRIGLIVFAETPSLAMSLTPVTEKLMSTKVKEALSKVDYRGSYRNISAAIELAIHRLKQNSKIGAEKLIIFVTDGIMDTGGSVEDVGESSARLRGALTSESKKAKIRMFGIALTDQAEFELIQALGKETNGNCYRATSAEDVQVAFGNIGETISKLRSERLAKLDVDGEGKGVPKLLLVGLVALAVLGTAVVVFMRIGKKGKTGKGVDVRASLVDLNSVTGKEIHKINKVFTTIGRTGGNDVRISKNTISSEHAQIEYRNRHFYLSDFDSRNGTYLNSGKERIVGEVLLKGSDIILFDQYKFKFILPVRSEKSEKNPHLQTILRFRDQ